jgi:hypothetical protein
MGQWDSCVKNDPCCGVSCTPPAKCSQGQCVTVCTKCETTACNAYSPNKGNCASGYQWYCECSDYNSSLGGYLKCEGKCEAMPSGNIRCVENRCQKSPDTSYPVCDPNGGYTDGSKCGCTDYDKGSLYEACGDCGCKQNLSCCSKLDGTKVCLSSCAGQLICTPNSTQNCTINVNGQDCAGTQTCKSDGSGWGECKPINQTCGWKTCTWKVCDENGVSCNVSKSATVKYNESCPTGCTSDDDCPNENCTWKTCENNDCTKPNTGIYPKGQCPKGCTITKDCETTHTCTWTECDTTTHTCSVTKTEDFPITQSCPTGCTNDSQCPHTHTCTWKECDTTKQTCSITKTEDYPLGQSCPTGCTFDSECRSSINYSCNTYTGQCYQDANGAYTSLSSCQKNCSITPPPPPPSTKWLCDIRTWTCSQSTSGYDTEEACKASCFPPCVIDRFTLNGKTNSPTPLIFWVGQKVHGEFITSNCDTCKVTSPNDVWSPPSSNSVWFTFKEPIQPTGTFTLNCSNSHNSDSETIVVQVRYLPRWREIIPNLGGFLKGLFRFK